MADLVEFCTWPSPENSFYEITSSALSFYVKTPRSAVIGLARKPGHSCDYWIVISNHPYSYINKTNEPRTKVRTPGILHAEHYQRFWIAWNGHYIRLGTTDESNPLIIYPNKVLGLKYITFDIRARRDGFPAYWKVEMPPQLSKPKIMPLVGGEPYWVTVGDQLPDNAIIGGHKNEALYLIRATHANSVTPGMFVPSLGLAFVSWGGNAHEKSNFEVLCGYNCAWVPCRDDRIPTNAVIGGHSEGNTHETLYIGRASIEGHIIPGKVQPSHKVCYVPYNSREIPQTFYEILVIPDEFNHTVSKVFVYDMEGDSGSESENDEDQIDPEWG